MASNLYCLHLSYLQAALLFWGQLGGDANEEYCLKIALIARDSGKLRNDTPQSPALKKGPRPVVMMSSATKWVPDPTRTECEDGPALY